MPSFSIGSTPVLFVQDADDDVLAVHVTKMDTRMSTASSPVE